jgi:hypothetical protein
MISRTPSDDFVKKKYHEEVTIMPPDSTSMKKRAEKPDSSML